MAKTTQRSTVKEKPATTAVAVKSFHDEYYRDMFTFKTNPVSLDYLKQFALDWVIWVEANPRAMSRVSFFNAKRVLASTVDRWIDRCVELQEAEEFVLQLLNERRELAPSENLLTEGWVRYTHSLFDARFKKLEEWKNDLRQKVAGAGGGNFVIEMNKMPESDIVPHRKVKDDLEQM